MTYRVLHDFADLQDGKHLYRAGDSFPRPGLAVSKARVDELLGSANATGYPLILADGAEAEPVKRTTRKRVKGDA